MKTQVPILWWIFCFALSADVCLAQTQAANEMPGEPQATFSVAVDEVSLTFHASDAHGLPVTNLTPNDLVIYDNLKPPKEILDFRVFRDLPIRVGLLLDTSESMMQFISPEKAVAAEYVRQFMRQKTDLAFTEAFAYISHVVQPWTRDPAALLRGVASVHLGLESPVGGTELFQHLYSACEHQFGKSDQPSSGRAILVFTDGEDNASFVSLSDVINACQLANTIIYAFRPYPLATNSSGPRNLANLTAETGGRVFFLDGSPDQISSDLRTIDADLRSRYWLVYKPTQLQHNGQFHDVYIGSATSANFTVDVRSGYYAPKH